MYGNHDFYRRINDWGMVTLGALLIFLAGVGVGVLLGLLV